MRVIAGSARGRPLKAPRGRAVRPTSARTREALFNILGGLVPGSRFLDLFAGSGAVGIEALSRGAALAVFVERDPRAVRALRENLARTRLEDRAEVLFLDAAPALRLLGHRGRAFELVFADPPYGSGFPGPLLDLLVRENLLAPAGLVILETGKRTPLPESAGGLRLLRHRRYGDSVLAFYVQKEVGDDHGNLSGEL
ncbi:MAG: 16S rRNA (guanine(966)-N(2))-methyltransferase RsmD [Firmicutes bacterium]|nr:16S rRNA (guanine(966)-N(2))-methyltransferase RsmD [Bacillota bacterium]